MRNINQLNETMMIIQTNIASNYQNIDKLNETMVIMQTNIDNYIASNDLTLETVNETLQYDVKTPMVIIVPNLDEINDHRSKFLKMPRITVIQLAKNFSFDLK